MTNPKITALREELKSIHFANVLFWGQGPEHTGASRAEYQHRQDRLQEIRRELYAYLVSQSVVANKSKPSSPVLSQRA
jgi:hypothetical protein